MYWSKVEQFVLGLPDMERFILGFSALGFLIVAISIYVWSRQVVSKMPLDKPRYVPIEDIKLSLDGELFIKPETRVIKKPLSRGYITITRHPSGRYTAVFPVDHVWGDRAVKPDGVTILHAYPGVVQRHRTSGDLRVGEIAYLPRRALLVAIDDVNYGTGEHEWLVNDLVTVRDRPSGEYCLEVTKTDTGGLVLTVPRRLSGQFHPYYSDFERLPVSYVQVMWEEEHVTVVRPDVQHINLTITVNDPEPEPEPGPSVWDILQED